jgi:hypothetical protein
VPLESASIVVAGGAGRRLGRTGDDDRAERQDGEPRGLYWGRALR